MLRSGRTPARAILLALGLISLGGCAALHPYEAAPPSSDRPWMAPEMPAYSAALSKSREAVAPASIDPTKTYGRAAE